VPRTVDKVYALGTKEHLVRAIPMLVCAHCGDRFLGPSATEHVDRSLGLDRRRSRGASVA
jgi:YgiT-type zinc finger domain-containing protein